MRLGAALLIFLPQLTSFPTEAGAVTHYTRGKIEKFHLRKLSKLWPGIARNVHIITETSFWTLRLRGLRFSLGILLSRSMLLARVCWRVFLPESRTPWGKLESLLWIRSPGTFGCLGKFALSCFPKTPNIPRRNNGRPRMSIFLTLA